MIAAVEKTQAEQPPQSHNVIVWERGDVFSQAVGFFIETGTEWNVIKVSSEGGVENLIEEVKRNNPEVVVLCQNKVDEDTNLPLRLIEEQPSLRVVTVSLESNVTQVYSKQTVLLLGVSDLLSIIASGYYLKRTPEKEAIEIK